MRDAPTAEVVEWTLAAAAPDSSTQYVLAAFVVVALIYLISLVLNPWRRCPRCKGRGRYRAWVFWYAHHDCPHCGGRGRMPRLGTKVLLKLGFNFIRGLARNRNLPRDGA